jgi:hypothetical protein
MGYNSETKKSQKERDERDALERLLIYWKLKYGITLKKQARPKKKCQGSGRYE